MHCSYPLHFLFSIHYFILELLHWAFSSTLMLPCCVLRSKRKARKADWKLNSWGFWSDKCGGLNDDPQNQCSCPNPWNSWMLPLVQRVFADLVKEIQIERSSGSPSDPKSMTSICIRAGQRKIMQAWERKRQCDHKGRGWTPVAV